MLGDGGAAHLEGLGELGDRRLAARESSQDCPAGRIGEGREGNEDGFTWQQHRKKGAAKPNASVVERVKPTENVQAAIDERMKPGMVFITTDQLATPDTHAAKDFTILDAEGVSGNEGGSSVLVTAP
jgi:hypothetical protein